MTTRPRRDRRRRLSPALMALCESARQFAVVYGQSVRNFDIGVKPPEQLEDAIAHLRVAARAFVASEAAPDAVSAE